MRSTITLFIPAALVLAAPVTALADDKPKESINLNYGKIEHEYTSQRDVSTGLPSGKRIHKASSVNAKTPKSTLKMTPELTRYKKANAGSTVPQRGLATNSATTARGGAIHSPGPQSISPNPAGPTPIPYPNIKR